MRSRSTRGRRHRRISIAIAALVALVALGLVAAGRIAEAVGGRPLPALWSKVEQRYAHRYPSLFSLIGPLAEAYVSAFHDELPGMRADLFDPDSWRGWGASTERAHVRPSYDDGGRPLSLDRAALGAQAGPPLRTVRVDRADAVLSALRDAVAGDEILLAPGSYRIRRRRIELGGAGTREHPIVVRAERLGQVKLELDTLEGFYVQAPYWVFENLDIGGVCGRLADCEHAFHVVGLGRSAIIRNNRLHDFNAQIKVNGTETGGELQYPDYGLVEGNSLYNASPRETDRSITPIDIVASDGWVADGNLIADFTTGQRDHPSYGAFIKGNASGGVLERNLVICGLRLPLDESPRVGLSLGGGGTARAACRGRSCVVESDGGIIRNNVILHCSDVGIYLNRARAAKVYNNTLFDSWGIDARFPDTKGRIVNNAYTGRIVDRKGAATYRSHNLKIGSDRPFRDPANADFSLTAPAAVVDRGALLDDVTDDFCGHPRAGSRYDVGAFEYREGETVCRPVPR